MEPHEQVDVRDLRFDYAGFGRAVTHFLRRERLSRRDLAKVLGCDEKLVRTTMGGGTCGLDIGLRLALLMGCDLSDFLVRKEPVSGRGVSCVTRGSAVSDGDAEARG